MPDYELRIMPVDQIRPADYNPRVALKPGDPEYEKLRASIADLGVIDPLVWNESTWHLVAGHQRLTVLMNEGKKDAPVFVVHLSEEKERQANIALNRISGRFDEDKLKSVLKGLSPAAVKLAGFDPKALRPMDIEPIIREDEPPEPPQISISKLGDIWQLGEHRLMCADSTDSGAWARLMNGEKADMVFTDPPYGVQIGDKNAKLNSFTNGVRCSENIVGDVMPEADLYEMLKTAFINVRENCTDEACYFVTSPQGGSLGLMMMMMKDAGLEVRHVLMWKKNIPTFSLGRLDYDYQHEPIFYTWTKRHHNFRAGENRTSVWEYDRVRKCDLHPTIKPVALVANAILDGSKEGMIVLDAFCGSGTTIVAAEQTNRKCRCMEIDPYYCDVIIQRWENLTGKKAVLLNGK